MQRLTLRLLLPILLLVAGSLAGCVAINPGLRLTPAPVADPDSFTADLVGAVVGRNYARLQTMMGSPFVLASWPGSAEELAPEAAVQRLEQELLGPATALTFVTPEVVAQWLGGADPLQLWPADVTPVRALGVSGLGADGAGQAVLIVAAYPDGSFYWYAMLLAPQGFPADGSTPPGIIEVVPTPVMPAILPTDIQQVLILGPVGIFASPNAQSVQVGTAVRGQTFPVIGASADGQWWAVVCPEATTTCWISANPTFVRPVRLPRPQPTSTPRPLPPTATPLPPTPGPAQPERISFPPGADRAVRSGPLYAATPKQYLFRAEAGQNATVRLASPSTTANFTIVGVSDGFPYKPQGNTARDFTFVVPRSQDYMITLFSTVNSSYTLELTIPRLGPTPMPTPERIIFAPGQDSAVRSGVLPGGGPKQYIFNARAGQVATLRLDSPPGSDANFSVRGMLDGVTYKAPTDPAREWSFLLPRTQDYLVTLRASGDTSYVLELVIPPIVGPTPTPIPVAPERINFVPGQQSAVRSGPLYAATPRQYVFRAEAGQTATVLFGSPSPAASFSIVGVEDGIPYKTTGNPAREFTFLIPRSQDYLLTLTAPVNTSYTLELTIPGPVGPTPTPVPSAPERITFAPGTDTAVRSGSLTPGQYKRYVFGAEAGQTATLQLTSPSPDANFTVVGVSDGIPYKSQGNSAIDFTFVLPLTQDYLVSVFAPVNTSYTLRLTIPPLAPPPPTATATILPTVIPPTPVEETPTPTPTLLPTVVPPTATPTETVLPTVEPPTATPTETLLPTVEPPTATPTETLLPTVEPPTATPTETPTAIAPIEPEPLPVEPVDPIEPPVP